MNYGSGKMKWNLYFFFFQQLTYVLLQIMCSSSSWNKIAEMLCQAVCSVLLTKSIMKTVELIVFQKCKIRSYFIGLVPKKADLLYDRFISFSVSLMLRLFSHKIVKSVFAGISIFLKQIISFTIISINYLFYNHQHQLFLLPSSASDSAPSISADSTTVISSATVRFCVECI